MGRGGGSGSKRNLMKKQTNKQINKQTLVQKHKKTNGNKGNKSKATKNKIQNQP